MGDQQTPYLNLNLGTDAERNANWVKLDARILALARGIFANIPAGGDLQGYYPDPTLSAAITARLPPTPVLPADVGKVLTVGGGGVLVWQTVPGAVWTDTNVNLQPVKGAYPVTTGPLTLSTPNLTTTPTSIQSVLPLGGINQGRVLYRFDVAQSSFTTAFTELVTASQAWSPPGTMGTTWSVAVTPNGTGAPQLAIMATGDGSILFPNIGATTGMYVGGSVVPVPEMLRVAGAIIIAGSHAASPVDGTLQYTGTKFQGRVAGAWVDIPGAGGGGGPPTGAAGGDLLGSTYPNPVIAPLAVTNAKINDVAWSKVTGAPTSFAPSGAAGGDLAGSTYPNPVIAAGAVTRAKTAADLWLPPIPTGADVGKLLTVAAGPTLAWQTPALGGSNGSLGTQAIYTSNATLTTANQDSLINANAAAVQLTLPAFSTALAGQVFRITRVDGSTNQATIMPAGADTIDGVNAFITIAPNESISLMVCGTIANQRNWVRVGNPTWRTNFSANWIMPCDPLKLILTQAVGDAIQWGTRTAKSRLIESRLADPIAVTQITHNFSFNGNSFGGASDDTASPSWSIRMRGTLSTGDDFSVLRAPPASGFPAFATLLNLDNLAQLTLANPATAGANALTFGSQTSKGRLTVSNSSPYVEFSLNRTIGNVQDDATKPSWFLALDGQTDVLQVNRCNVGNTQQTIQMVLDSAGKLSLPGSAPAAMIQMTSQLAAARIQAATAAPWLALTVNRNAAAGTQDDATKPSWQFIMRADSDLLAWQRSPAGSASMVNLLAMDSGGRLTLAGDPAISQQTYLAIASYGSTGVSGLEPQITFRKSRLSGGAVQGNEEVGTLYASPCYGSGQYHIGGYLHFVTAEVHTASAAGTNFYLNTCPVGSISATSQLLFDQGGNLTITGATATKASGTTWANPSDRRLKDNIVDYLVGLDALMLLQPRSFTWNGKGGSQAGLADNGLVADEIPAALARMVFTTPGTIDGEPTDIQTLDQSDLVLVLVNAVKELAARVAALEARP